MGDDRGRDGDHDQRSGLDLVGDSRSGNQPAWMGDGTAPGKTENEVKDAKIHETDHRASDCDAGDPGVCGDRGERISEPEPARTELISGESVESSEPIIPIEQPNPHWYKKYRPTVKSLPVNKKPQSPRVGIGDGSPQVGKAGRQAKPRNDQPPHIPHCEWRASNKRTDGELSWRLLAIVEWNDPVSGDKMRKTQHVGYLPSVVWIYMKGFDYEKRQQICEREIGDKARASRQSLEAYREEAIRLSIDRNGGARSAVA